MYNIYLIAIAIPICHFFFSYIVVCDRQHCHAQRFLWYSTVSDKDKLVLAHLSTPMLGWSPHLITPACITLDDCGRLFMSTGVPLLNNPGLCTIYHTCTRTHMHTSIVSSVIAKVLFKQPLTHTHGRGRTVRQPTPISHWPRTEKKKKKNQPLLVKDWKMTKSLERFPFFLLFANTAGSKNNNNSVRRRI